MIPGSKRQDITSCGRALRAYTAALLLSDARLERARPSS